MSVEDFTGEFDRLRMRCYVDEEDEQTVARYFASLRPEISDVVQLQQFFSYNDVCRLALKVEAQLKKKISNSQFSKRAMGTENGKRVVGLFEGKYHPDEFIDWLHTVERVFDIKNLNDEQKVKLVAIKLKKNASIWWEHVKKQRVREGKPKILSWYKMKKKMMAKFIPVNYKQ
nr:reverse transcriptase domain-containing protein [Tanacetum cinerariifolium]